MSELYETFEASGGGGSGWWITKVTAKRTGGRRKKSRWKRRTAPLQIPCPQRVPAA